MGLRALTSYTFATTLTYSVTFSVAFILTVGIAIPFTAAAAQTTGTISGRITDLENGQPIVAAQVTIGKTMFRAPNRAADSEMAGCAGGA